MARESSVDGVLRDDFTRNHCVLCCRYLALGLQKEKYVRCFFCFFGLPTNAFGVYLGSVIVNNTYFA